MSIRKTFGAIGSARFLLWDSCENGTAVVVRKMAKAAISQLTSLSETMFVNAIVLDLGARHSLNEFGKAQGYDTTGFRGWTILKKVQSFYSCLMKLFITFMMM